MKGKNYKKTRQKEHKKHTGSQHLWLEVFSRQDREGDGTIKNGLSNDHTIVYRNLLLYISRVIRLLIDVVTSRRSRRSLFSIS